MCLGLPLIFLYYCLRDFYFKFGFRSATALPRCLKGTHAWNNFEFFWPKSNPYMPLVHFRKKFRLFSFDFRQNFEVRTFSRWLNIRGTKFFLERYSKKFFFKNFTLVLLNRFLNGFSKFRFFVVEICILFGDFWVIFKNYSMRMLSIRGNDFIAHWAYKEMISSHTEHTRNKFSCKSASGKMWTVFTCKSMLSMCETHFIAHWAYAERISSLAEHTRNGFHRWLSIRGNV
jgi:hypothetical protein